MSEISISILIPIYNFDCRALVTQIHYQCTNILVDFEILCYDDFSKDDYKGINSQIEALNNVSYILLESNHGRSKIRNLLAKNAKNKFVLFLDCDSKIISDNFIKKYLESMHINEVDLIYGGTSYQTNKPNIEYQTHWYYGKTIESQNSEIRNKLPYESFKSNNFLANRKIFNSISFDKSIDGYGYEDNIFALQAQKSGFSIIHIDNTVLHEGLEKNEVYILKIEESIKSLKYVSSKYGFGTKMTKIGNLIIRSGVGHLLKFLFPNLGLFFQKRLLKHPLKLYNLQLYKLIIYINQ